MTSSLIDRLSRARVAVIGDVMIDTYIKGTIERISPEAPVPVLRAQSQSAVPGGAANVAANIAALGAMPLLVGIIGADGGDLYNVLLAQGVTWHDGLVIARDRQTIRKQRIMSGQQIVRVDFEDTRPVSPDIEAELVAKALAAIAEADTIVLSDYGKGALSPAVIRAVTLAARELGKTVIADPKSRDLTIYRGASILTPNRAELTAATGLPCETDEQAEQAVRVAQQAFGGDILLTRSEKGLSFYPATGPTSHYPTLARQVFDVSGAGDTVVGTLAVAIATRIAIPEAIRIANQAAGIVVAKVGTATASLTELSERMELTDGHGVTEGQMVTAQAAGALARMWQQQGLKVGFTNGCFDLVHPGHISLIRQAAAACDRLILALNTDASVKRLKGPSRPVQPEQARAEVIGAVRGVDAVVLFDEATPLELIELIKPDILIKGADYTAETVVGADVVLKQGGSVILANLVAGQSTTRLIATS
jgi:D-beta-D-heptose 7-phosphate kinase/D-beta-D-heptose 1-phosphate adenosyltransferase